MEFPWVTNDNSVHLCQGPASGYLELYYILMNIVSTRIISVSFITVLLNILQNLYLHSFTIFILIVLLLIRPHKMLF